MKEATIKDIAALAQVSITTVSRVINGNYPVSQDARERVEQAIRKLNYRPNAVARGLRRSRTNLVAMVVPDISNHFFMEAAKGLEGSLQHSGRSLVIASSDSSPEKERQLLDALLERRVDGLVIAAVDHQSDTIRNFLQMGIPVVLIDRPVEGLAVNEVRWNDRETSRRLTEELIENNHRRIGIVNVTLENPNGRARLDGYLDALAQAGIPPREEYISPSGFSDQDARDFVCRVMNLPTPPTALYCANNIMVEGTLHALGQLGLKIWQDVSLIAFGDLICNRYIHPGITCALQDGLEMGEKAGDILCSLLEKGDGAPRRIILDAPLCRFDSVRRL
ncbi:MAG TPA: LacI family transcriptional regulator [Candidatus Fournierella merdigallinarum]|nr:LacI family transcriptional regulator [Candidatus Fournierella merdigallinarum]